jgi:ADP-ribose pyrophosphatase YjhB (NUDIX family)
MVLQGQPNESPSWAVPGGSIDSDETPQQAAVRETREETGLGVQILRPYCVVEGVKTHGAYRVHFFEAEIVGGEMRARDPDDLIHCVAWIPIEKLHDLQLSHEDQREILTGFLTTRGSLS